MSPRNEAENERIRDERREAILQAAVKAFTKWGYASTKIADIAAEAGISHGLVYHYFQSKDQIFGALVDLAMQVALQTTRDAAEQPGTPWDRIAGMVETMVMGARYGPEFYSLVQQAFASEAVPEAIRRTAWEQGRLCQEAMTRVIAEGQAAGQVIPGDPRQLAALVYAFVQGLALTHMAALRCGGAMVEMFDPDAVLRMLKAVNAETKEGAGKG
ncbi:MAG: TetR/AcrR family transcriptional regulator [Bacteroidota bacterium]